MTKAATPTPDGMTPLGAARIHGAGLMTPRAAVQPIGVLAPLRIGSRARPSLGTRIGAAVGGLTPAGRTARARANRYGPYNFDQWNF